MGAYIKLGDYNSNYKYIIATCFFNYLTYFLFNGIKEILIISKKIEDKTRDFSRHGVINDISNYLGIIIISFILYKYNGKESRNNKQNNNYIENNSSEILLIHNDIKEKFNISISFLNLFLVLIYWCLIDHTTRIIESLMIFDYPMFELLFTSLVISKMLKIGIYSHQKIGIIINSLSSLILGILRFIYVEEKEDNIYLNAKYEWFIPVSIIIYIFIISSTSYIYTKLKFYMDLKFISHTKLLILYGIIGFVFSISACTIETSFKCAENKNVTEFFCKVYSNITNSPNNINNAYNHEIISNNGILIYNENNSNNKTDRYIENLFIFIEDFLKLNSKDKSIEIVLVFFGTISYYCSLYFDILVIKYLTPMHFSFCNLIYLLLLEITELIKNKMNNSFYKNNLFKIAPFIASFIGFLIYLEIIELNFCNLNYNFRKYINIRSIEDVYEDSRDESIISNDEIFDNRASINATELSINKKNK